MKKWICRDFDLQHYGQVEALLDEMEHFKRITLNDQVRKKIIAIYLRSCLEDSTFTKIVIDQGKVVGIICGRYGKQLKKSAFTIYTLGILIRIIGLHIVEEGRKAIKTYKQYAHEYERFIGEGVDSFEGELNLLLVHQAYRGLGIGQALWNECIKEMRKNEVKDFCLMTDSTCDYSFYEGQGCKRIVQQKVFLGEDMEIYLYAKKV